MAPKLEANRLSKWLSRVVVSRIIANSVCVCVCVLEIWPSGVEEKAIYGVGAWSLWPNNKYRPGPEFHYCCTTGGEHLERGGLKKVLFIQFVFPASIVQ